MNRYTFTIIKFRARKSSYVTIMANSIEDARSQFDTSRANGTKLLQVSVS